MRWIFVGYHAWPVLLTAASRVPRACPRTRIPGQARAWGVTVGLMFAWVMPTSPVFPSRLAVCAPDALATARSRRRGVA